MKYTIQKFLILCIIIVLYGCSKEQMNDCFQATGDDITQTRSVNTFSRLVIGENFDMTLTQDTNLPEAVIITAGSKIINQIKTSVNNYTLNIENKNTCNFVRSYNRKIKIEIRVKFLDYIEISSASNLVSNDTLHFEKIPKLTLNNFGLGDIKLKIKTGWLNIRTINSGNLILEGFSNILTCSIEEATILDARNLLCDDVYIDSHTPLDCYVNARKQLFAKIFNSGNVYYVSEPEKKPELVEQRGSGGLFKL